jgi:hypothetical protein
MATHIIIILTTMGTLHLLSRVHLHLVDHHLHKGPLLTHQALHTLL